MRLIFVMPLAALAVTSAAHADWTGKGEAGLVFASGNTETETANAKLEMVNEAVRWKSTLGAAALYASDEAGKTAQRWQTYGQADYNFTPQTFSFGAGRYEQDEFSGFEFQATASVGIGRRFIDIDPTKLVATAGVGYKFFETRDAFDADTGTFIEAGESDREGILRGTLDFEHDFTDTTSLIDKLVVEAGADNTFLQNDVSLQVKINAVLALAVGYSVRHNTQPPAGFQETDTLTTVNLVYEIR